MWTFFSFACHSKLRARFCFVVVRSPWSSSLSLCFFWIKIISRPISVTLQWLARPLVVAVVFDSLSSSALCWKLDLLLCTQDEWHVDLFMMMKWKGFQRIQIETNETWNIEIEKEIEKNIKIQWLMDLLSATTILSSSSWSFFFSSFEFHRCHDFKINIQKCLSIISAGKILPSQCGVAYLITQRVNR